MAKVISNANFDADRSSYDWNSWLDGQAYLIEKGEDYTCEDVTMLTLIRTQARNRGMSVRTKVIKDSGIQFQAYEASDEQKAEWARQDAEKEAKKAQEKAEKERAKAAKSETSKEDAALEQQMDNEVKEKGKKRSRKAKKDEAATEHQTESN